MRLLTARDPWADVVHDGLFLVHVALLIHDGVLQAQQLLSAVASDLLSQACSWPPARRAQGSAGCNGGCCWLPGGPALAGCVGGKH